LRVTLDKLSVLEKAALVTLAAGNAFNILLFAMGATLQDATTGAWLVARLVFAVVQFVAFDLTIIATVQAMRDGRRGRWAGATVFVAALAAALIGLDVSTVRLPFLHAAYAVVLPLFMMHLATERQPSVNEAATEHQPRLEAPQPTPTPLYPSVAHLRDVDGLSFAEIGKRLNISRQAAQQRYKKEAA
jgi:hypothetical protein